MRKFFTLWLFTVLPLICVQAQLKIDSTGNIGLIGPPSLENVRILNSDNNNAFRINSFFGGASSAAFKYSFRSSTTGSSGSYGVYGIWNVTANSNGKATIGILNEITNAGSGSKVGVRSKLDDNSFAATFGSNFILATDVQIKHYNQQRAYGNLITIENRATSSDTIFGNYIDIQDKGGSARAVGVYSSVPAGAGNLAGEFIGDVCITGSMMCTSDERLKTGIEDLTNSLDLLAELRPKKYWFTNGERFSFNEDVEQYGFIAQEVEQVLPSFVEDISYPATYDIREPRDSTDLVSIANEEDRILVSPSATYKAIKYNEFIPLLVKGVQEQQVQISDLTDQVTDLARLGLNRSNAVDSKPPSSELTEQLLKENQELKTNFSALLAEVENLKSQLASLKECTDCFGSREVLEGNFENDRVKLVSVYPNPAQNLVTVNHKESRSYTIRVRDTNGRHILNAKSETNVKSIDTSTWPGGTYIFEVIEDSIVTERLKVVINR